MNIDDFQQHSLDTIAITQKGHAALADYFDIRLSDIAQQNMDQSTRFKNSRDN